MFEYTDGLDRNNISGSAKRAFPLSARRGGSEPSLTCFGAPVQNGLLRALPTAVLEDLKPFLEWVPLRRRQVLHERNLPVTHAYFLERGLASLMAKAEDHCMLEVATLGQQDFVGLPLVLGTARTPHRCVVHVPGEAWRISAEHLEKALSRIPILRKMLMAYVQAASVQSAQLVVCNACHSLQQRLARWLLFADDRVDGHEIAMTHQVLGRALGVRRAGITTAMGRMEELGLIARGRGRVSILDRPGLEGEACDCYRAIRSEYARITCDSIPGPAKVLMPQ